MCEFIQFTSVTP